MSTVAVVGSAAGATALQALAMPAPAVAAPLAGLGVQGLEGRVGGVARGALIDITATCGPRPLAARRAMDSVFSVHAYRLSHDYLMSTGIDRGLNDF